MSFWVLTEEKSFVYTDIVKKISKYLGKVFISLLCFFLLALSFDTTALAAADPIVGNEVIDAENATLTRTGAGTAGNPYKLQLNLGNANTWTTAQTFNANTIFPGSGIWNTSGNVGVGTASPLEKVHVIGNILSSGNVTAGNITASGTILSSGNIGIGGTGAVYRINGSTVLSSTTLGSGVVNSSLTSVGALSGGSIGTGFGVINTGADNITTSGTIGTLNTTTFAGAGFSGTTGTFSSSGNAVTLSGTGANINFSGSGTGQIVTNNQHLKLMPGSGNIGIGGSVPGEKFDVYGGNGRVESGFNWLTTSDVRYKKNITTLEDALGKTLNLRGVRYDLFDETNVVPGQGKQIGFIAQELEKEYPELVYADNSGKKSVAYDKMTAILLEAIKQQQKQILQLQEEVNKLKSQN